MMRQLYRQLMADASVKRKGPCFGKKAECKLSRSSVGFTKAGFTKADVLNDVPTVQASDDRCKHETQGLALNRTV